MNLSTPEVYWKKVTIPKGLPAILETVAREVIRENPQEIIPFIANLLDQLIAKRDQKEGQNDKGKADEEDPLLNKNKKIDISQNADEEIAASKIQAGFRGYKTRKHLKNKKKGGANSEDSDEEQANDEAIAAEIKTPLETIREESIDGGSFRAKTPAAAPTEIIEEANDAPADIAVAVAPTQTETSVEIVEKSKDTSAEILEVAPTQIEIVEFDPTSAELVAVAPTETKIPETSSDISSEIVPDLQPLALQELIEEDELLEIRENLAEEISLDDGTKSDSDCGVFLEGVLDPGSQSQSEGEVEMMEQRINEVLLNDSEEDLNSLTMTPGTADGKGASLEIHESEVETLMESENNNLDIDDGQVEFNTDDNELVEKDSRAEPPAEKSQVDKSSEAPQDEEILDTKIESQPSNVENSPSLVSNDIGDVNEIEVNDDTSKVEESKSENQVPTEKSESVDKIDEKIDEILINNNSEIETDVGPSSPKIPVENSETINTISFELPSLNTSRSFALTDSASSSTTATVRHNPPSEFDKQENSSQDTSICEQETPVPKPRRPATISTELMDADEAKESVEALESIEPAPVMRRHKSSPTKQRGKVVSSKYRSGIVMDDEVSMEEMEAQIENEMMSQAAVKIQAGFRGYKTRKNIRKSGVSFDESIKKAKHSSTPTDTDNEASIATKCDLECANASASPNASAESLPNYKSKPPPLAFLRSRSYPGSAEGGVPNESDEEEEEVPHEVELDYDPAYVNNAAVKIQASVRGYLVRQSFKRDKKPKKYAQKPEDSQDEDDKEQNTELIINPADRDSVSPLSEVESSSATKIQAAFRGYKDRQKVRQTKKAVVTIQATVRGFLTRRRLNKLRRRSMQRRRSSGKSMMSPEIQKMQNANDAAIKIQSVYRGYQVRSKIRRSGKDE